MADARWVAWPGYRRSAPMYLHTQLLINDILPDEPDPAAANALQEGATAEVELKNADNPGA